MSGSSSQNTLSFDGKVVIVTGAGGGLGRAHALEFAERGAYVVVNDLGGTVDGKGGAPIAAQVVVDEINAKFGDGTAVANFDTVATQEGAAAIIATALETWSRVDVVVNNAGILRDHMITGVTDEDVDLIIGTHLKGTLYVSQAAWRTMKTQGGGRIVNTTSAAGLFGNPGQSAYGAGKGGIYSITRALAAEGGMFGIAVNAIAPVGRTRMTEELFGELMDAFDPEFISPVVAWLAHDATPVTGEVYSCGGGHVARVAMLVGQGITLPDLSAEAIAANAETIRRLDNAFEPTNLTEEIEATLKSLAPPETVEEARAGQGLGTLALDKDGSADYADPVGAS